MLDMSLLEHLEASQLKLPLPTQNFTTATCTTNFYKTYNEIYLTCKVFPISTGRQLFASYNAVKLSRGGLNAVSSLRS